METFKQKIQTCAKGLIALALGLGLGACSYAPGMHVQNSLWHKHGPDVIPAQGINNTDIANFIEVKPITDELIASLTKTELDQSLRIPGELLTPEASKPYVIGINDVLAIVVWGQPELVASGGGQGGVPLAARQVKSDGTIFFPYAGILKVAGKTRQQVRKQLTKKLSKFFQDPQIDVSVEQYNSQRVALSGAFNQPTVIPLRGTPLTLDQAISLAQGFTPEADIKNLQIVRDGKLHSLNYHRLASNGSLSQITLKDGDAIYMPINQDKAYIVGEVGSAQKLTIQAGGLTLTDAIGSAGGLSTTTSDGDLVYVIRGAADKEGRPQIYRLPASSPSAFLLASKFSIQPQDVIFVGASGITRWNRVISPLFPSTNLFNATNNL